MAYTNAVFHLDYENGSDAARSLPGGSTVSVSNPSGTITRVTKNGHGLVTGAVVTLTNFSSWLNGTWKITKNDDNTFDLDGAVWQSTADPNGDCVPFGGMNWTDAWKTISNGATAARIAPGDTIKIAKSSDPVSIGNATWNERSKTVTLATAQTKAVDNCETAWTNANSSTVTRQGVATDAKEGSYCMQITAPASPATGTKYAYYNIADDNYSSYQKLSLWLKNEVALSAGNWKICLCSDDTGDTIVDTFEIPAIPSTGQWVVFNIAKTGGGNLGSDIKSVALYSGTAAPTASKYVRIDNLVACTTDGLNLTSLISKNTLAKDGTEAWYGIQSINGTTILLDNYTNTKANEGRGYEGSTETVTTYKRETIKTSLASSSSTTVQDIKDSGTAGSEIVFKGGYNTSTGNQDGETFFDGSNCFGYAIICSTQYVNFDHINLTRYNLGFNITTLGNCNISANNLNNNQAGIYVSATTNTVSIKNACNNRYYGVRIEGGNNTINIDNASNQVDGSSAGVLFGNAGINNPNIGEIKKANNNALHGVSFGNLACNNIITLITDVCYNDGSGVRFNSAHSNEIKTITNANNNVLCGVSFTSASLNLIGKITNANNNGAYGIEFGDLANNNEIMSASTTGNGTSGVYTVKANTNYLRSATIAEAVEVSGYTDFNNGRVYSNKHDNTANNHWIFTDGGTINSLATDRVGGTGIMWKLAITSSNRSAGYPLCLSVAKIAVVADKLVTVKAYMKKDHAINIGAQLFCRGGQLTGVASDVSTTKASDTNWEELMITFTPTEAGVIEIEARAYYVAGNSNAYIEDMTITQAS